MASGTPGMCKLDGLVVAGAGRVQPRGKMLRALAHLDGKAG
jgi:hypothetical protein